jgi:DNA polymerase-3 subunit epsilon
VRLSRNLYKEHKKHNLSELIERFQFQVAKRHRAFDDAKVLWDFLQLIYRQFEPAVVEKAMKQVLIKHRAPTKIKLSPHSQLIYEDDGAFN